MFDFDALEFQDCNDMERSSLCQPSDQAFKHHQSLVQMHEKQSAVAFDVALHSLTRSGWHFVSIAKERLEKYDERKSAQTKQMLEEVLGQKCQKVKERLMERKDKARQHNSKVSERVLDIQHWRQEQVQTKKMLEQRFIQKCHKAEAQLAERKQKAYQHNKKVAERLWIAQQQQQQQQQQERQQDIKARLEQTKGSEVNGELFSCGNVSKSVLGIRLQAQPEDNILEMLVQARGILAQGVEDGTLAKALGVQPVEKHTSDVQARGFGTLSKAAEDGTLAKLRVQPVEEDITKAVARAYGILAKGAEDGTLAKLLGVHPVNNVRVKAQMALTKGAKDDTLTKLLRLYSVNDVRAQAQMGLMTGAEDAALAKLFSVHRVNNVRVRARIGLTQGAQDGTLQAARAKAMKENPVGQLKAEGVGDVHVQAEQPTEPLPAEEKVAEESKVESAPGSSTASSMEVIGNVAESPIATGLPIWCWIVTPAQEKQAGTKKVLEQDFSQKRQKATAQAKTQARIYYVPTRPKHQVVIEDTAIDTAGSGACLSLFASPMYILDKFARGLRG